MVSRIIEINVRGPSYQKYYEALLYRVKNDRWEYSSCWAHDFTIINNAGRKDISP
jgi:hypothetical protein